MQNHLKIQLLPVCINKLPNHQCGNEKPPKVKVTMSYYTIINVWNLVQLLSFLNMIQIV